jgi:hypothetical protein
MLESPDMIAAADGETTFVRNVMKRTKCTSASAITCGSPPTIA